MVTRRKINELETDGRQVVNRNFKKNRQTIDKLQDLFNLSVKDEDEKKRAG